MWFGGIGDCRRVPYGCKTVTFPTTDVAQDLLENIENEEVWDSMLEEPSNLKGQDVSAEQVEVNIHKVGCWCEQNQNLYLIDMEKIILDMEKDELLREYQYFVGG